MSVILFDLLQKVNAVALGDILGLIDREQDLVVEYAYDPWGKPLEARSLTTECDKLAELNPFRYRGYGYDEQAEMYYLRSRYYSPEWGRFINADYLAGKRGKLFYHNVFTYGKNKPISIIDPGGSETKSIYDTNTALGKALNDVLNIRINEIKQSIESRILALKAMYKIPNRAKVKVSWGKRDYTKIDLASKAIADKASDVVFGTITAGTGIVISEGISAMVDVYGSMEDKTPKVGLYESVTYEFKWTYNMALFPAPYEEGFRREDFEKRVVIRDCFRADPINDFTEVVEVFDGGFGYNGISEDAVEYQNIE